MRCMLLHADNRQDYRSGRGREFAFSSEGGLGIDRLSLIGVPNDLRNSLVESRMFRTQRSEFRKFRIFHPFSVNPLPQRALVVHG